MEKKQSFYKSQHEKDLARVVDNFYNDAIGGNENSYMDGTIYHAYTEEELVAEIIKSILSSQEPLRLENTIWALEPKHIKFMGKKRVSEIVGHRVNYRHNKEGSWLWEN